MKPRPKSTNTKTERTTSALAISLLVAAVLGCNPSTARPPFFPFRPSAIDTVAATMGEAIEAVRLRLMADSVPVHRFDREDGYLETEWIQFEEVDGPRGNVVIRLWADPILGQRVRLTAEVAYEWTRDPSRIQRDRERSAPVDHPARTYIINTMRAVRDSISP